MLAPMSTSSLEEVLVAWPVPKALTAALDKSWTSPTERDRLPFNRPSEGKTFRPSPKSSEGLLAYLTGLVSQGARGTESISLLGIEVSGKVIHIHSLLCVSAVDYDETVLGGC